MAPPSRTLREELAAQAARKEIIARRKQVEENHTVVQGEIVYPNGRVAR